MPQQKHQQPIQRQIQPQKLVAHSEVHAPMEPPQPEVPNEAQKPDEPLDQVRHPPTPEDPVGEETEVPEPLQVAIVTPKPKQMFQNNQYLRFYLCPDLCHCLIQYQKCLINPFHIKI